MLRIFLIFVAIYKFVEKPEDVRVIVFSLIVAFAIQATLVYMEYYIGRPLLRLPGESREADIVGTIFRPSGSMGHSSNFGKFAPLCLPICLALIFVVKKNIWRICAGSVLIVGLVSLILTVSRAGLATSLFGLGWMFLIMTKKRRKKKIVTLISFSFLIVAIGLSWLLGGHRFLSRMEQDFGSALSRPQMFSVAWNVIKGNPLLGVGLNNYRLVAPNYDRTPEAISITYPTPVHNIYMLHAAEMGIPGAVFFTWFLFGAILKAFRCSSDARFLFDSAIMRAIGIGISCSWLQGLIGQGFRSSIIHTSYLAVFAGALVALKYYNQNVKQEIS